MSRFFQKQTKGKTIRRDSKTQVTKTNKGEKTQQENKRENPKNERHEKNTEDTKKRKNKKTICFKDLLLKKIFAKRKKDKNISTPNEKTAKKKRWKHTEIIIKSGKSRNKEDIFSDVNFNSKKIQKRDTQRNDKSRYKR